MSNRKVEQQSVYCSGALFCLEEVKAMADIAGTLEGAGFKTYLPHRDGVEAFALNSVNNPLANLLVFRPIVRFISRATFALDIFKIFQCGYFVFNMNGAVPDEGGVVETGVAFAAGKPVVVYMDDTRRETGCPNHLLLGATGTFETIKRIEDIPAALESAERHLRSLGGSAAGERDMPRHVRRVARFGGLVDRVLRLASFFRPENVMSV